MTYHVMVRCPNSDKAVATGIQCDIEEFISLSPSKPFTCSACGDEHNWSVDDAWLRDANFVRSQLAQRNAA